MTATTATATRTAETTAATTFIKFAATANKRRATAATANTAQEIFARARAQKIAQAVAGTTGFQRQRDFAIAA
jgi:hypothetical protein